MDADGNPQPEPDLIAWARWHEKADRHLARDVENVDGVEVTISTVFLGLDHSFGVGDPVLWETMVFGGKLAQECEQYTSKEDAFRGHVEMVARVLSSVRIETERPS